MKEVLRYIYYYLYKTVIMQKVYKHRGKRANRKYGRDLTKMHLRHDGERCFLVATGPSLVVEDLELLKNEYCISVNTIFRIFNKTKWRPNLYGTQDREVFNKIKGDIENVKNEFGDIVIGDCVGNYDIPALYYHLDMQYHLLGNNETKFTQQADRVIYDGFSVTYSMIQIAVYLGFKEIYLLGCDTNYRGPSSHFDGNTDELPKGIDKFYDSAVAAYTVAKKFADQNGISIINCTRGGMLEVFPRKTLEEVLK